MSQPEPLQVEGNPNEPILGAQQGRGGAIGGNAATVRRNFWREMSADVQVKSAYVRILFWSIWLVYSVYLMWTTRHTNCETPLAFWTCSMILLHISHSTIALDRTRPQQEVQTRITNAGFLIFVWYVFGSGWVTPNQCDPSIIRNGNWLWWLMTGLYLAPCFLGIIILCCFPIILVALPYLIVPSANRIATREDIITKLTKTKYSDLPPVPSAEDSGLEVMCSICTEDFTPDSMVVRLPCHPKHTFHEDCIIAWLRMSQLCPICRRNINELVSGQPAQPATGGGEGGNGADGTV
eukprot:GDKI01046468.1.p1 GENE.GDKI01046468.1~~GDKI01046468.1.p1  ORF type:complete len:294 (-),score=15.92 GDKI01046468.1:39-920(-)